MKHLLALGAALLLLSPGLFAQKTFKKAFTGSAPKVSIFIEKAEIEISGYSGNEIQIEAEGSFPGPPERAKGLKPLYNSAEDNTGIGLAQSWKLPRMERQRLLDKFEASLNN